eukprot:303136-Hanusia_phi.AAC.1
MSPVSSSDHRMASDPIIISIIQRLPSPIRSPRSARAVTHPTESSSCQAVIMPQIHSHGPAARRRTTRRRSLTVTMTGRDGHWQ